MTTQTCICAPEFPENRGNDYISGAKPGDYSKNSYSDEYIKNSYSEDYIKRTTPGCSLSDLDSSVLSGSETPGFFTRLDPDAWWKDIVKKHEEDEAQEKKNYGCMSLDPDAWWKDIVKKHKEDEAQEKKNYGCMPHRDNYVTKLEDIELGITKFDCTLPSSYEFKPNLDYSLDDFNKRCSEHIERSAREEKERRDRLDALLNKENKYTFKLSQSYDLKPNLDDVNSHSEFSSLENKPWWPDVDPDPWGAKLKYKLESLDLDKYTSLTNPFGIGPKPWNPDPFDPFRPKPDPWRPEPFGIFPKPDPWEPDPFGIEPKKNPYEEWADDYIAVLTGKKMRVLGEPIPGCDPDILALVVARKLGPLTW